ncbi:hypothetical protein [Nocardia heshunensis]
MSDSSTDVIEGGDCDVADGQVDVCWDDSNYATCSNGQWIVRPCAAGTVCNDDGNGNVTCGWANDDGDN